jgi:hypothetical protein
VPLSRTGAEISLRNPIAAPRFRIGYSLQASAQAAIHFPCLMTITFLFNRSGNSDETSALDSFKGYFDSVGRQSVDECGKQIAV